MPEAGDDRVGGFAADEGQNRGEPGGGGDHEATVRCAATAAGDLLAAERLAGEVFEEGFDETGGDGVDEIVGARQGLGKCAVLKGGEDEAVIRGEGEVQGEQAPAFGGEVAAQEGECGFERETGEGGLAGGGEVGVEARGARAAGRVAAGVENMAGGAGALALEHVAQTPDRFRTQAAGGVSRRFEKRAIGSPMNGGIGEDVTETDTGENG